MDNLDYLKLRGVTDPEALQTCLEVMAKYGENHWWEPDVDPRKYAYYQMVEPIQIGEWQHFLDSLRLLFGRPLFDAEIGLCNDALVQEAERAWKYQVGATSETERKERVVGALQQIATYFQERNVPVIVLPDE